MIEKEIPDNCLMKSCPLLLMGPLLFFVSNLAITKTLAESPRLQIVGDTILEPTASGAVSVQLPNSIGDSDFTIGLSIEADGTDKQALGDLVSLWNAKTRHGINLSLRNNTGNSNSQANWRQLQFGMDAGTEPVWTDEGRPGSAILGFSLTVHDGHLYVGTCEVAENSVGRVYRYQGPGQWEPTGNLDGSNSVTALATYKGQLYAGTGKYRTAGSSLEESTNATTGGRIFRFVKQGEWELVGELPETESIASLVTFGGKLYASSMYQPAGFFRYDSDKNWTPIPTPDNKRVNALGVHGRFLYATSYDSGAVYRFDGETWKDLGLVDENITQTYSFTTFEDSLHVSTWPLAKVYRLEANGRWTDRGQMGDEKEVMAMLVHNGSFYGGTLPLGEVYRYEGETSWKLLKQIDVTPDVRYRRVWTMSTYQGKLFATTLPSGKIWSMSAGTLVTHDHELGAGWHDIVAERKAGKLRLLVDGKQVAETDAKALNLDPAGLELKIGSGPSGVFKGRLKNVWFERH